MNNENEISLISIGGLARASGVPVETLRNWERRYGFPEPSRLDSGHRRYPWAIVPRLRSIRQVLALGFKPSFAVGASTEELERIISDTRGAGEEQARVETEAEKDLDSWMDAVEKMDSVRLTTAFHRSWSRLGASEFLLGLTVPFLREIGDRWEDGSLSVAHEHFASESLQSFLSSQWRPLANRGTNGRVVLANFEGELHSIGLHICAVFLVLKDLEPVFLGPNTPTSDIVTAARQTGVRAAVIGFSKVSDLARAGRELADMIRSLPSDVILVYGGNEQLPAMDGLRYLDSFEAFERWVEEISRA